MTIVVLVALAAVWAAVLLPPYLQKRRATHPSSSVVDFHQQLAVLQRTGRALNGAPLRAGYTPRALDRRPRPNPNIPRPAAIQTDVMRRRRDVFTTLLVAAGMTLLLSLIFGGNVWLLHLMIDAALLGYAALLLQIQQQQPAQYSQYSRPSPPVTPAWAEAHGYDDVQYDDGYGGEVYDDGYGGYQPQPAYAPAQYGGYNESRLPQPRLAEVHYIAPPRLRPVGPSATQQALLRRPAN